jgi:hypothetical protein
MAGAAAAKPGVNCQPERAGLLGLIKQANDRTLSSSQSTSG